MIAFYVLNLVCLAALLLLTYTETLWARFSLLALVIGIALGWFTSGNYSLSVFALACLFTAFASFKMEAIRFHKIVLSVASALMFISMLGRILELPVVTPILFVMWLVGAACSFEFIRQIVTKKGPSDQSGILLILSFEAWYQAIQVFRL